MRTQPTRLRTGLLKKNMTYAVIAAIAVMLGCVVWYITANGLPYFPPPFESAAQKGTPQPPDNMGYGKIEAQGGFAFSIAGAMYQQEDGSLALYLTNHENSAVWIMCEIVDENENVLYKSGILRPGEYVERLYPKRKLENDAMKIEVKVYGFEPETYHSRGSVFLNNILQAW